ncbi:MAG: UTP--glucose-1-phosphate uridylyltransferase [Chloroflexi bacterium]|nr:UTP--glucose-1-phosphate uridylyltransferase [Chloroflexota bacterium]
MQKNQDVYKAVIPVGGLGTRLLPATKVLPKELLPVGRRPMVQYVVEEMRAAGLENICFVTGRRKTLIQEHFDHDPELVRHLQDRGLDELLAELAYLESGFHLTYIRQSGPQGLADALSLAEDFVAGQPFVLALGDSIMCEPEMGSLLRKMIREHLEHDVAATIAVEKLPPERAKAYSFVLPQEGTAVQAEVFEVAEVSDKPPQPSGNWAIAARFVFSPAIFAAIRRSRPSRAGELRLTDAIRILLRQGKKVQAVPLSPDQRHHDIGSFGGYFRAFLEFALKDHYYGAEVRSYLEELMARKEEWYGDE